MFSCFAKTINTRVCTDLTEGKASALCLLNHGTVARAHKFSVVDIVLSCDIGGATTDIVLSMVSSTGKLEPWPQLTVQPVGVVSIDEAFSKLI